MLIKIRSYLPLVLLFLGIAVLTIISLFTGVTDIHYRELFHQEDKLLVFTITRIPRTLTLLLLGAGMSISGAIMQQLSQNRFVSPTTSGALESAKMGILIALILFPGVSFLGRLGLSLVVTFLCSSLFMGFIAKIPLRSTVFIPLVGIIFGSILNALATFFAYKHNIVQNVQEWLLGDFSSVMQGQYEAVYIVVPAVILVYFYADRFTLAGMGESFAVNLGLSYQAVLRIGLLAVSLVVSVSMVTVGALPFVGLIIPNMVRIYRGDNLRPNLPWIAGMGSVFLLVCDIFSRLIVYPYEIPIGVTVGVIGGISFLVLILRKEAQ